jgi:hypothetical protein
VAFEHLAADDSAADVALSVNAKALKACSYLRRI